ncbi:MAG: hypothetical protein CMA63_02235 [Euryarchaeota archaeon]|nr:hypothetical protein [Euryarchaeota archaeon]|tara:strand:+ start:21631 stop:22203 length:573 start_codon:yes stop_codon:yes gene_type:complete
MTDTQKRLQQLLNGEIDPEEIAHDPVLVSLADRIYGIKIAPANPVKARDMPDTPIPGGPLTEVAPPTDMLIEVIGDLAPSQPAAVEPLPQLETLEVDTAKKPRGLQFILVAGIAAIAANLFGLFGSLLGNVCEEGQVCPRDGSTRIMLLDAYKIDSTAGWGLPAPDAFGIPDVIALVVLIGAFLWTLRKS